MKLRIKKRRREKLPDIMLINSRPVTKTTKQQKQKQTKATTSRGEKPSEPRVLLYFLKLLVFNKIV